MTDSGDAELDIPRALNAALMVRSTAETAVGSGFRPNLAAAILAVYADQAADGESGHLVLGRIVAEQATALAFTLDLWAKSAGVPAGELVEQIAEQWRKA